MTTVAFHEDAYTEMLEAAQSYEKGRPGSDFLSSTLLRQPLNRLSPARKPALSWAVRFAKNF
jgi:hypothetical protein